MIYGRTIHEIITLKVWITENSNLNEYYKSLINDFKEHKNKK